MANEIRSILHPPREIDRRVETEEDPATSLATGLSDMVPLTTGRPIRLGGMLDGLLPRESHGTPPDAVPGTIPSEERLHVVISLAS